MKADGVLNLLKFQRFQSVRMTSSLVRSTNSIPCNSTVAGDFCLSAGYTFAYIMILIDYHPEIDLFFTNRRYHLK